MRVAFVLDQYREGKGGLERWLAAFAAHLAWRGHTPHLLCAGRAAPPPFVPHPARPRGLARARRDRSFAEAAAAVCAAERFDAVVGLRHCLACDVYAPHGGTAAATFAGRARPPARVETFLALERELLTGAAPPWLILAVSEQVRRDVAARFPGVADRVRVVVNGVDLARFTPEGREAAKARLAPEGGRVALFIAANPRLKGVREALLAFGEMPARRRGGPPPPRRREPRPPAPGARWLGPLSRPEEAYRAADVVLMPTRYDPFPLSLLEALACGTPVVTDGTERRSRPRGPGRSGAGGGGPGGRRGARPGGRDPALRGPARRGAGRRRTLPAGGEPRRPRSRW